MDGCNYVPDTDTSSPPNAPSQALSTVPDLPTRASSNSANPRYVPKIPSELLARGGAYTQLYEEQFRHLSEPPSRSAQTLRT